MCWPRPAGSWCAAARATTSRPAPCRHGPVIKPVAAGVPRVVAPLGRAQRDTAAGVVPAGAGWWISKRAAAPATHDAIARVLDEPRYRAGARRMAATLAAERND